MYKPRGLFPECYGNLLTILKDTKQQIVAIDLL